MSGRPRVCLVDPCDDGHHPMYAAVYAQAFAALGMDVWLLAPPGLLRAMPAVEEMPTTTIPWEVLRSDGQSTEPGEEISVRLWKSLGRALEAHALESNDYPDFLVLLYLDSFISELLPRAVIESSVRCRFAGLWFKPPRPLGWGSRDIAKRIIRWGRRYQSLQSPLCDAVLLLDTVGHGIGSSAGRPKIIGVPEFSVTRLPAVEPQLVTEVRRRAAGRRICAMVGSLESRKGIRAFLQAAETAPTDEWFFVMAGKVVWSTFDAELREAIGRLSAGPENRILLVDQWLEDETLNAVIAVSNLLHACYENWPYSSNMLCKAATFRVPVLAADIGYLGRTVRAYGLGLTVLSGAHMPAKFVSGFSDQVAALAERPDFQQGCNKYLAENRPEALVDALKSGLAGIFSGLTRGRKGDTQ